ncbi:hypothetical protein [Calothrix sp. PCC 7507]|uniref:hypothetical protein n=1 Tax=Calothrix sp. PCC 7507 TaxID=99598 RepID=UPI00030D51BC|nr:hypothetical protein [Calothrix sp. PCC 7507]
MCLIYLESAVSIGRSPWDTNIILPHSSSVDTILKAIARILKMCCNSEKLKPEAIA